MDHMAEAGRMKGACWCSRRGLHILTRSAHARLLVPKLYAQALMGMNDWAGAGSVGLLLSHSQAAA